MTLRYEVTLEMPLEKTAEVTRYMQERHIPEILATGCFRTIRFERATETRFRTCYEAPTVADLDRYLTEHAERFREDFRREVGDGASVVREVWEEVKGWGKEE